MASATFVLGAGVSGAAGYAIGTGVAAAASQPDGTPSPTGWQPSPDADLEQLRQLAANAPLDDLIAKAIPFLAARSAAYRTDPVLFVGVSRLAHAVLDRPAARIDPGLIAAILSAIEHGRPPRHLALEPLIPALRERRSRARQER